MPYKFNPFTGNLDLVDTNAAAGSDTQIQYNDSGTLAGSADLTWDDTGKKLGVGGDIDLTGSISVPLGNNTSPSVYFGTDTDTGLYSPGANQVAISTNGTSRLYIASDGKVGVGTTTPGSSFEIARTSGELLRINTTTTTGGYMSFRTNNVNIGFLGAADQLSGGSSSDLNIRSESNLIFSSNGAIERLRITSDGKLGLGTSSPANLLHIAGTGSDLVGLRIVNTQHNAAVASTSQQKLGITNSLGERNVRIQAREEAVNSNSVALDFFTNSAAAADSETVKMTIKGDGNVGIGTTTVSAGLHVVTDVNPVLSLDRGTANNTNANLYYNGTLTGQLAAANADFQISAAGASTPMSFYVNGIQRAAIDTSGRLLVGTSSNSGGALLQVNGNRIRVGTAKTPASASDTGTAGEICWDSSYIYVCTATDTWKRAALSTW